jgi:hypothetical protein
VCHRKVRIEFGSALKRADRLTVIETEDHDQSLIEKALRLGIMRRNRMIEVARPGEQAYDCFGLAARRFVMMLAQGERRGGDGRQGAQGPPESHSFSLAYHQRENADCKISRLNVLLTKRVRVVTI